MKRNLFYAFFALSLMTGNAMAVETTVPTLQVVTRKTTCHIVSENS